MSWHWWYVNDEDGVRWAVRVQASTLASRRKAPRIVFTSAQRQISAPYPLLKDEDQLTRAEVLSFLARAKAEAESRPVPLARAAPAA